MNDYVKDFSDNGYVILRGFLDRENCDQLTDVLVTSTKIMVHDAQCPSSLGIHSKDLPALDSLLEQLLPHFEAASGKKLLPTYAYARMYKPGEVLQKHLDRESCEISATLTLGFDGDPWPIFMSAEENPADQPSPISLHVGDAVLYRGEELYHWRDEYQQGEWQAQVFLHYVDAEGPNAEFIYDKRPRLSHHGMMLTPNVEILRGGEALVFYNAFSRDTCQRILASIEAEQGEAAGIGTAAECTINKEIRDVSRINVPVTHGIGATLTGIGINLNNMYYKFDVQGSVQSEFLRYGLGGHYNTHLDTFLDMNNPSLDYTQTRKLTVLLFLNDDFEGGKLFLRTGDEKYYPPQDAGNVLVFPSFLPHSVDPVSKGQRTSLVNWLIGPMFR